MDRETRLKMKDAEKKAKEAIEKQKLAQDPENVEYWLSKKESMENILKQRKSEMAEIEFLVECYEEKIQSFN